MASLLSLGNPLSSARGEPRALGHLAQSREEPGFAGCQRLTFLGDAKRAAVPRSPERNPTWMWTLILSLSWLAQSSLQAAYRISLAYSGPAAAFNISFAGAVYQGATANHFLYNNYNVPAAGQPCKLRIYSSTGTEEASINSGPEYSEGALLPQSSKAAVLGQVTGIYVFTVTELAGTMALAVDAALSRPTLNHLAYFAAGISDTGSSTMFAMAYNPNSTAAIFYKIALLDAANYQSYTLPAAYGMTGGAQSLCSGPADTVMAIGAGKLLFLDKTGLSFVKILSNPDFGFLIKPEPTDQTVAYAGSLKGSSDYLSKIDTSTAVWQALLPPMSVITFVVNLVRFPVFRVALFHEVSVNGIRLFDIDSMTVVAAQAISGSVSVLSMTYGMTVGKSCFSAVVNPGTTTLQVYNLTVDYCAVAWQNPCTACQAGTYRLGTGADNRCLRLAEIPDGYGVQGADAVACLTGCLRCRTNASACTLCDDTNGYYLYPATSGCLLVNQIPDTFGLDKTTTPFSIAACTVPQCQQCQADRTICDGCGTSYFLREPSDNVCRLNNTAGYGSIVVAGQGRLAPCSTANCDDCRADHTICVSCAANYYPRAGQTQGCYSNTADGFGVDATGYPLVLRVCADLHCRSCLADHRVCDVCQPNYYRLLDGCAPDSSGQRPGSAASNSSATNTTYTLKAVQPTYYNAKQKKFVVLFTEPLAPSGVDLSGALEWTLTSTTGKVYSTAEYSVRLAVTGAGELAGEMEAAGFIEESVLTIVHQNKSRVVLRSAESSFDPNHNIKVQLFKSAPKDAARDTLAAVSKQGSLGISGVSLVTIFSSSAGGSRLASLLSVMEYIEYVFFVDGVRVIKGDEFLEIFSFDPFQLIPNQLISEDASRMCDPGPNFARGQMKCDILSNCGVQIQSIAAVCAACLLFYWAVPIGINKLKSPKAKTVLQAVNYIPSHFFSPSLLLALVEGPQIDLIRSAVLNLLVYWTHRSDPNRLGLFVSAALVALYGAYAVQLARLGLGTLLQRTADDPLPPQRFFRETFERIRLPQRETAVSRLDRLRVLVPSAVVVKNAAVQTVIVMLAGHGMVQIYLVLGLQVANLGMWAGLRPYSKWGDNVHMIIVAVAKLCISICLIIVNTKSFNINFEEREKYFGLLLIVLYSACVLSVLLNIVVDTSVQLWRWISSKKPRVGQMSKNSASEVEFKPTITPDKAQALRLIRTSSESNLQINSLKNIAPISSMKRGFVSSQKMIKISKPDMKRESCNTIRLNYSRPENLLIRIQLQKQALTRDNSTSESRSKLLEFQRREDVDEQNSTTRSVKDPKASFVSVSSTKQLIKKPIQLSRGSLQELTQLKDSNPDSARQAANILAEIKTRWVVPRYLDRK